MLLHADLPLEWVGPVTVVIGLTAEDMYTRDKPDWRYAF